MSSYFEETDRANLSPVFIDYYAIINHSFCTQPKTKTMAYEIYKSIFIQKRDSIHVTPPVSLFFSTIDGTFEFSLPALFFFFSLSKRIGPCRNLVGLGGSQNE